jgi:hypothetical protein
MVFDHGNRRRLASPFERRGATRFPMDGELSYSVLGGKTRTKGTGKLVNISSNGVLFATEEVLPPGARIELSVIWPVRLNERCSLKLVAKAKVVRWKEGKVAARIIGYEFRTRRSDSTDASRAAAAISELQEFVETTP